MRILVHIGADLDQVLARQADFLAWSQPPNTLMMLTTSDRFAVLRRAVPCATIAAMPAKSDDPVLADIRAFAPDLFVPAGMNLTCAEERLISELGSALVARLPSPRNAKQSEDDREARLRAELAAVTRELNDARSRFLDHERRIRRLHKDRETLEALYQDIRAANSALERHVGDCEQRFNDDRAALERHLNALMASRWWQTGHRVKTWMQRVKRKLSV